MMICVFCRHCLSARFSRTEEIYGTTSGNECNVSYVLLHAPDLRYAVQRTMYVDLSPTI